MRYLRLCAALAVALSGCGSFAAAPLLRVEYPGFTLWLDCAERGAQRFHYRAEADTGTLRRAAGFALDPDVPARCQQATTASYRYATESYDRGHLVPANHLDHLPDGIRQSNRMTNILPQASGMNRGAWLRTEEIIECHRDIEPLEVWGGVFWGFDGKNDHFIASHGVRTPDYFWKIVISAANPARHIAWIVPNRSDATRARLDEYLVPVADIEMFTGLAFPLPAAMKHVVPVTSWALPANCDKG